jgi:CO/xanthine dehydrogenase Mo-binding subunit
MKRTAFVLAIAGSLTAAGAHAQEPGAAPASAVPRSAFFAALGGSYNFVNFGPQWVYNKGISNVYQGGALTFWTSTQMPHRAKSMLAETLGLPDHQIRVIAPEVGGGFGCKVGLYDEEVLAAFAAIKLGRPVKWIETRSESLAATTHGRGQTHEAELAVARDGTFLALRVRGVADLGACLEAFTAGPPLLCGRLITGAYRIPAASYALRGAFTNKTPTGTYRGPGRFECTFVRERLIDMVAKALDLDPSEVRRRNFLQPEDMPYEVGGEALGQHTVNVRVGREVVAPVKVWVVAKQ